MSKRKQGKESWEAFERRVGLKRTRQDRNLASGKNEHLFQMTLVQRMSTTPSGRLKKYEPLDTGDFVPFAEYKELSICRILKKLVNSSLTHRHGRVTF